MPARAPWQFESFNGGDRQKLLQGAWPQARQLNLVTPMTAATICLMVSSEPPSHLLLMPQLPHPKQRKS
jgi:hypothetical protein